MPVCSTVGEVPLLISKYTQCYYAIGSAYNTQYTQSNITTNILIINNNTIIDNI